MSETAIRFYRLLVEARRQGYPVHEAKTVARWIVGQSVLFELLCDFRLDEMQAIDPFDDNGEVRLLGIRLTDDHADLDGITLVFELDG